MKSQPSTVYLQYRNREDALIASQTLYDDTGQLLLLKNANVSQQDSRTKMSDIQMHMKRSDAHPNFHVSNPIRRSRSRSRSSSRASASRYRSRSRDKQDLQHRFGRVNGRDASPTVTPLKHDHERASEDGCIPPLVRDTDRSIDSASRNSGRVWNAHGRGTRSTVGWRNDRDIGGHHAGRMGKNLPHPRSKSRSRSQERYDRRGEMPGRYPRPSTRHNHRNDFFHQKRTHYNRDGPCSLNRSQYDRQDSRKESNAHSVYQRSTVPSYQNPTRHWLVNQIEKRSYGYERVERAVCNNRNTTFAAGTSNSSEWPQSSPTEYSSKYAQAMLRSHFSVALRRLWFRLKGTR